MDVWTNAMVESAKETADRAEALVKQPKREVFKRRLYKKYTFRGRRYKIYNGAIRKRNLNLLLNKIGETFCHMLKRLQT